MEVSKIFYTTGITCLGLPKIAKTAKPNLKDLASKATIGLEARQLAIHEARTSATIRTIFENTPHKMQASLIETALLKAVACDSDETVKVVLEYASHNNIQIERVTLKKAYKLAMIRDATPSAMMIITQLSPTKAERTEMVKEINENKRRVALCATIITAERINASKSEEYRSKLTQHFASLTAGQRDALGPTLAALPEERRATFLKSIISSFLQFFINQPSSFPEERVWQRTLEAFATAQ